MLFVPYISVFRYFQQMLWKSRKKKRKGLICCLILKILLQELLLLPQSVQHMETQVCVISPARSLTTKGCKLCGPTVICIFFIKCRNLKHRLCKTEPLNTSNL